MIGIIKKLLSSPGGKKAAANLYKQMKAQMRGKGANRLTADQTSAMRDAARREQMAAKINERAMRQEFKRHGGSMQQDLGESMRSLRREFSKTHPGTPKGIRERAINSFPGIKTRR